MVMPSKHFKKNIIGHAYDAYSRLNGITANNTAEIGYTFDNLNRRATASLNDSTAWTYGYNNRSEVTGAVRKDVGDATVNSMAYSFDNIGNRLTSAEDGTDKNYAANQLNQYTAINSELPTYDDDGNMLAAHGWTLTWDAENRLVSAVNGTARLEFVYDAYSRRREKKVYASDVLTKHEKYLYNGYKLIAICDALNDNTRIMTFVWQPIELDIPLCMTYNNAKYYYLADGNKNITGLFEATGNRVATYTYAPFGGILSATGTMAAINPFRFSSEQFDMETSLVYYNYRYYSPVLGRWISRDPIGEWGCLNINNFLENDSINFWDFWGLDKFVFDGSKICRISDDGKKCIKCWEAVSGKTNNTGEYDYSKSRQKIESKGPIPEGEYLIPSNKVNNPSKRGNWDLEDWNNYEKNRWPWQTRVKQRRSVSWGRSFGRLEPKEKTDTFGRNNFNIHGGTSKGSAGCIDIGNNEKDFFKQLRTDFKKEGEATVIVDYSGISSKSCDCAKVSSAEWKD